MTPEFEKAIVESGIVLIKYWLEVSPEEQTRRLEARIDDPRKIWKLSPMDLKSYNRWYDYSRARDDMFKATDTPWAPWRVVRSDDKKRARLNTIAHLLSQIPYEELPRESRSCRSGRSRTAMSSPTIRTRSCRNSTGEKAERRDFLRGVSDQGARSRDRSRRVLKAVRASTASKRSPELRSEDTRSLRLCVADPINSEHRQGNRRRFKATTDGTGRDAALVHSDVLRDGAVLGGLALPQFERAYFSDYAFDVSVSSAQAYLSAAASGMMALTGIVFAMAFVMVQFSAIAYSPRLVLWFARDRMMFHALGAFTATFVYALFTLVWVDRGGAAKVPLFSTLSWGS